MENTVALVPYESIVPAIMTQTVAVTPVSLEFTQDVSYDEWAEVGKSLQLMNKAVQWWIGDWLAYGEYHYGDITHQAVEATGYEAQSLWDMKWVSYSIKSSRRRELLSWSHHREVAALEPAEQDEWLERAETEHWTRSEFRDAICKAKRRALAIGQSQSLPSGVFQIIYADPPWQYDNSGLGGSAESHYPTMSTSEICALGVAGMAAPDSVLFLWVTNPMLADGLTVMSTWGFEYKTNLVWVKQRETYGKLGFYVYGQHELLLIGVRGSMLPIGDKPASIITGSSTVHSRKPDEAYAVIESMYPGLARVELFARQTRDGWTAWGLEAGKWASSP